MTIHRIEIHTNPDHTNPQAEEVRRAAATLLHRETPDTLTVRAIEVYLIEADLRENDLQRLAHDLLTDPITQNPIHGTSPSTDSDHTNIIEIHPLPGVMDPVARSVELAVRELLDTESRVHTATRYDMIGLTPDEANRIAEKLLANPVVNAIHHEPYHPEAFPEAHTAPDHIHEVPLLNLNDEALTKLSRESHLFLSLNEMRAIRDEYKTIGREPRDIELETLAQTWSEHCVHKTLKSVIQYHGDLPPTPDNQPRPGVETNDDGSVTINNLLKSTVAAATHELMADGLDEWCLSVFVDNAGIVAFDDETAVCFKVETHNHPSAIEPYGGAATGIGGCIRDVIGTGLAARPIASTDIFCVADPFMSSSNVPAGCLHPRRILTQIVAGVRDYGNRMGIPTINGAVWFDDRYIGNPLVYCGSIGVMPRDRTHGDAQPGDHIIVLGGATGRDGIHGATFSSAELTDTHADEFSHAVQIGNPITEKKTLDAIIKARDHAEGCLFSAITDCGAGGFSSAVGEMGETLGAEVHLERAPLKYAGLTPTEIWISEAQERMVLAVPEQNIEIIAEICRIEDVDWCDLGTFGTPDRQLILNHTGTEVGRLSMHFLHNGIPTPTRKAMWNTKTSRTGFQPVQNSSGTGFQPVQAAKPRQESTGNIPNLLLTLLAHPNIASKHWIIRQYDHEVQGATAVKPLTGPDRIGPSDAAVIQPKLDSTRGLAIANGLSTGLAADPYLMTIAAIDECVRNLVCTGADPSRIAILDNFCWPSCDKPENLGSLVRAALGCYDAAKAYRTPFISGKDSLNNQFTTEAGTTIEIPPTLLISGFGIVPDVRRCITMDAKRPGNLLIIVGETGHELAGSHIAQLIEESQPGLDEMPAVDLSLGPQLAATVANLIYNDLVRSAHDISDGGLLVAASEMAIAGYLGIDLTLTDLPTRADPDLLTRCFAETPSRYLLEIDPQIKPNLDEILTDVPWAIIGTFTDTDSLRLDEANLNIPLAELKYAWRNTLDW